MKLLIITQVVDKNYVPLCFAVEWFREFGKQCEKVTVIGQQVGEYSLPSNVHVLSLKKEAGKSKLLQVLRFYRLAWKYRNDYEAVFVHMTPIWVVFGAPLWLLLRKRMYLWYEARGTGWNLRWGLKFVRKAFSASQGGMPIKTAKSVLTGHGVDISFFTPPKFSSSEESAAADDESRSPSTLRPFDKSQDRLRSGQAPLRTGFSTPQAAPLPSSLEENRDPNLIITVGRLTKAKRLDLIVQCFATLPSAYRLRIIGVPITKGDHGTLAVIHALIQTLGIDDRVTFATIPDEELRVLLRKATLFLHASEATSLDKAPLQAMASGCLVVTASPVVKPHVPEICRAEPGTMGPVAAKLLALSKEDDQSFRKELRSIVERNHSLPVLIQRLVREMS